jgi:hypothetical protein
MKKSRLLSFSVLLVVLTFAQALFAGPVPGRSQTTLLLQFDHQDIAPNDPSRVTVPAGEIVAVRGMLFSFASITAVQWLKNGQPIPNQQGLILLLGFVSAADAGEYRAQLTLADGRTQLSQALRLSVVTTGD